MGLLIIVFAGQAFVTKRMSTLLRIFFMVFPKTEFSIHDLKKYFSKLFLASVLSLVFKSMYRVLSTQFLQRKSLVIDMHGQPHGKQRCATYLARNLITCGYRVYNAIPSYTRPPMGADSGYTMQSHHIPDRLWEQTQGIQCNLIIYQTDYGTQTQGIQCNPIIYQTDYGTRLKADA